MDDLKLGAIEQRFADIIWENEPITSGELVKKCSDELGWKKSTTYTVLKKLCERRIFTNNSGTVVSLISKSDFFALKSERFVSETFDGSLPAFIAAFTSRKELTTDEIEQIKCMIDNYGKEK